MTLKKGEQVVRLIDKTAIEAFKHYGWTEYTSTPKTSKALKDTTPAVKTKQTKK